MGWLVYWILRFNLSDSRWMILGKHDAITSYKETGVSRVSYLNCVIFLPHTETVFCVRVGSNCLLLQLKCIAIGFCISFDNLIIIMFPCGWYLVYIVWWPVKVTQVYRGLLIEIKIKRTNPCPKELTRVILSEKFMKYKVVMGGPLACLFHYRLKIQSFIGFPLGDIWCTFYNLHDTSITL